MAALVKADIFTDLRLKYDINYAEKEDKLDLYLRETIDDIYVECPFVGDKTEDIAVTGGILTFPANTEMIYKVFSGPIEFKPVDIFRYHELKQSNNLTGNYGLITLNDSGAFQVKLEGIDDSTISVAYKTRKDDVTALPDVMKYIVESGISWRYEKYEQKIDSKEYQITWNLFQDKLKDYSIRVGKQVDRTLKTNYTDQWTEILTRL